MTSQDKTVSSYGSWSSPVTSDMLAGKIVGLNQPASDGTISYWLEDRTQEQGRTVLVRRDGDGQIEDLTPQPFNVRSRVHEYGGGAYCLAGDRVVFANLEDQRLYLRAPDGKIAALTGEDDLRYADLLFDRRRNRVIAVREDHRTTGEPVNTLVSIDLDSGGQSVLVEGHDFFSSPRLSADGRRLAWLSWDHPNMPWDGTELWMADIGSDGTLGTACLVAGGPEISVFQPEWSPDGILHFVSDRSGWWNLYRCDGHETRALCPMAAEFGEPQWQFGMTTYGFLPDGRIVCRFLKDGDAHLGLLGGETGGLREIAAPYRAIRNLQVGRDGILFIGADAVHPAAVVRLSPDGGPPEVLRRSLDMTLDPGYFSDPQSISFPTTGGQTAHAYFYPPRNPDFCAPVGTKPPLLVTCHGGPTAAATPAFNLAIQFWTSRGLAVVDVNYGGSTGYGRAYRNRLWGNWGIVDLDDVVNAARYLAGQGLVSDSDMAIRGGSAGGYTTLSALTFRDFFKAGVSYYGVGDLESLARDTHKFESRYMDRLVGPYPARRTIYFERSPINFTDRLNCAMILLQGEDDKVVPPNQAEDMFRVVKSKGLPVALLSFPGEGHGFRRSANIKRAAEAELSFYGQIFGFAPAGDIEPVTLENRPASLR